jgi:hypothetical protein
MQTKPTKDNLPLNAIQSSPSSSSCCSTTDEGAVICIVPVGESTTSCGSSTEEKTAVSTKSQSLPKTTYSLEEIS